MTNALHAYDQVWSLDIGIYLLVRHGWTLAIFRGHKQRTLAEKPSVHAGIVLLSLIFLATQTTRHELQKFKTVLFCEKNHDQKLAKPHHGC